MARAEPQEDDEVAGAGSVQDAQEEAMAVALRRHTLLALDDCLYALQASIPQKTRSSLHRQFQRRDLSRLPAIEGDKTARKAFKATQSAASTSTSLRPTISCA